MGGVILSCEYGFWTRDQRPTNHDVPILVLPHTAIECVCFHRLICELEVPKSVRPGPAAEIVAEIKPYFFQAQAPPPRSQLTSTSLSPFLLSLRYFGSNLCSRCTCFIPADNECDFLGRDLCNTLEEHSQPLTYQSRLSHPCNCMLPNVDTIVGSTYSARYARSCAAQKSTP